MPLHKEVSCLECVQFVKETSACREYKASVDASKLINCYFYTTNPKKAIQPPEIKVEKKKAKKRVSKSLPSIHKDKQPA